MRLCLPIIFRSSLKKVLEEAREDAARETAAMYETRMKNMKDMLTKEHHIQLSQRDAKISTLQAVIADHQEVNRDAADLSIRAVHFIQKVKQFAAEDAYQSHQMMDAVVRYHQTRERIADESKNILEDATKELADGRHKLIAGM